MASSKSTNSNTNDFFAILKADFEDILSSFDENILEDSSYSDICENVSKF